MPEIVGIVNHLGYLYCNECADKLGRLDSDVDIFKDSSSHAFEECDMCEQVFK